MCEFAACADEATEFDDGWHFCRPCLRIHLAMVAEEQTRDCAHCFLPFASADPRRTHCNRCKRFRKDNRPTYARRLK